jgi:hypothetical protein
MSCVICSRGEIRPKDGMFSLELVRSRSSEEDSDSSYSSWLLVLRWRATCEIRDADAAGCRRLRRIFWDWTRRPVVITSLSIEDREEEDGWEEISTQDSAWGSLLAGF